MSELVAYVLVTLAGLGNQYFQYHEEQSAISRLERIAVYNRLNFI